MANIKLLVGGCSVKKAKLGLSFYNIQAGRFDLEGSSTMTGDMEDGVSSVESMKGEFCIGKHFASYGCRLCRNKFVFQCNGCDAFVCYDGKEGHVTCPLCGKDCLVPATKDDRIVRASEQKKMQIMIAIDVSGSMSGSRLRESQSAAINELVRKFPKAEFALVTFESTVRTVLNFTSNTSTVEREINGLYASGGTHSPLPHINSTFPLFARKIDRTVDKYLVILTDGEWFDTGDDQIRLADTFKQSGVTIITIGCDGADTKFLSKLASPGASIQARDGAIGSGFASAAKRISQN